MSAAAAAPFSAALCLSALQACKRWSDTVALVRPWCVQGNFQNGGAYGFILFITFWILYSYLVPISLFVTLEIVKFWQARHPCCGNP